MSLSPRGTAARTKLRSPKGPKSPGASARAPRFQFAAALRMAFATRPLRAGNLSRRAPHRRKLPGNGRKRVANRPQRSGAMPDARRTIGNSPEAVRYAPRSVRYALEAVPGVSGPSDTRCGGLATSPPASNSIRKPRERSSASRSARSSASQNTLASRSSVLPTSAITSAAVSTFCRRAKWSKADNTTKRSPPELGIALPSICSRDGATAPRYSTFAQQTSQTSDAET